jgi:probable F420-dependent oxidoreductase
MLALGAQRSIGAHPYFVPVEHTAIARGVIGSGPVLAVAQTIALTTDRGAARRIADDQMRFYLARRPYRANLERFGWSEADMEGAGSDALLDAIVAWGDVDAIRTRVEAHFDAGADHVCIQPLGARPDDPQLETLRQLAPALIER